MRAYKIAMTPPMAPVLLVANHELQGRPNTQRDLRIPKLTPTAPPQGDSASVAQAARLLVAAERPLIAAVFHRRLRLGMPLQSDPTVIYERGDPQDRRIGREDLIADSDYNTYQHRGLPPGPIANPGLSALEAVVEPAGGDYLYFVARNDGTHEFSRTLEEHNRAVRRYQRQGSP